MISRIPRQFCDEISNMDSIFEGIAKSVGDSKEFAIQLLQVLPQAIRKAVVWHDRLTDLWRYEFGLPFDRMPYNQPVIGTNQFPIVLYLYNAMKTAKKYLTESQLIEFTRRLEDEAKHQEVLFEMRPAVGLAKPFKVLFEVESLGVGNKRIDWYLNSRRLKILFDVKCRLGSLVNHLEQIIEGDRQGNIKIPPNAPDPANLFKSTEEKFKRRCSCRILQGVWINTGIKEHEEALKKYFFEILDPKKIHFAILSDWKDDAYFLTRRRFHKRTLKKVFGLVESERFVTDNY